MDRAFTEEESPQQKIKHTGIAIARTPWGRHIGILYRNDEEWYLLDLVLHMERQSILRNTAMPIPGQQYIWVNPEPAIPEMRLEALAGFCRLVWERNQEGDVPYGFSKPSGWFDSTTGERLVDAQLIGLTCATFVLTVFADARLPLVNTATWIARADDKQAQEELLAFVEKTAANRQHIEAVRASIPAIRYRPEEVAGAGTCDPIPADFEACVKAGAEILKMLDEAS